MVGAGFAMLALAVYSLFLVMGEMVPNHKRMLTILTFAMFLPYLANTAGWLMTEMGRYPWIVFGLMKIENASSPTVAAGMILTTLVLFTLVYAVLMVADIYLLSKYARAGISAETGELLADEQAPSFVEGQG